MEDRRRIAQHYLHSTFALDLLGVLPWDLLAIAAAAPLGLAVPGWVPLLKLLHMVRAGGVGAFGRGGAEAWAEALCCRAHCYCTVPCNRERDVSFCFAVP